MRGKAGGFVEGTAEMRAADAGERCEVGQRYLIREFASMYSCTMRNRRVPIRRAPGRPLATAALPGQCE